MMNRLKRPTYAIAASTALLVTSAIIFAQTEFAPSALSVAPVASTGSDTIGNTLINVGQPVIGRADDGRGVFAHMGVIPIYVASIPSTLGDCTGNHIVDLDDYDVLHGCLEGPDAGLGRGCECADLDNDSDVDLRDAAIHARQYGPSS